MGDATLFGEELATVGSARISDDGRYRYLLSRAWGSGPTVTWVMLNPSTADATEDDPTLRRCRSFSEANGYGALHVVNLWPFRSPAPDVLASAGPVAAAGDRLEQSRAFGHALHSSALVVVAWGAHYPRISKLLGAPPQIGPSRIGDIAADLGLRVACLGRTDIGEPRHPLYLKAATALEDWA